VGFFFGGPMGADAGTFGAPTPGGAATDAASGAVDSGAQAIGDHLSGGPVEDFPPTPGQTFDGGPT